MIEWIKLDEWNEQKCCKHVYNVVEAWITTTKEDNQLQTMEIEFFKGIFGKIIRDRIKHIIISEKLRLEEV